MIKGKNEWLTEVVQVSRWQLIGASRDLRNERQVVDGVVRVVWRVELEQFRDEILCDTTTTTTVVTERTEQNETLLLQRALTTKYDRNERRRVRINEST